MTEHDPTSIVVRFQFISSKDEQSAEFVTLFFTTDNASTDISTWTNVTIAFSDINDIVQANSDIVGGKLWKIHNNYIMVLGGLEKEVRYYIRLQISFFKTSSYPKPFIIPTWTFVLPGKLILFSRKKANEVPAFEIIFTIDFLVCGFCFVCVNRKEKTIFVSKKNCLPQLELYQKC